MATAIVVEDGTGTEPTANSYVSAAEFATYWTNLGFDYTEYTTDEIERSLMVATHYIELNFGMLFKGCPLEEDQPLAFPREGIYLNWQELPAMPKQLKYATFEYAKRVLTSDNNLQPDPADRDETGNQLSYTFTKVGPIEEKIQYLPGSGGIEVQSYPAADAWLEYLLIGGSGGGRTVRN